MEKVETLESRIESLTKKMEPDEVMELECGGSCASNLSGLLDRFTNLQVLDLTGVGLESLKGFPSLPNLCELDLSENQISAGLELLEGCQKLFVLGLRGNQINDLDTIKPLVKLEMLRELDLSKCEISKMENYREKVFELLKSLMYLDGFDKDNKVEAQSKVYKDTENGGVDVDEEDTSDEEDDEDDEEDDENEVGLSYLQKSDLGDDDSKDYEAAESDDDEEDDDIDEDEDIDEEEIKEVQSEESECGVGEGTQRGRKRKQPEIEEVKQE